MDEIIRKDTAMMAKVMNDLARGVRTMSVTAVTNRRGEIISRMESIQDQPTFHIDYTYISN